MLPTPPTGQGLASVLSSPNSPVATRFHAGRLNSCSAAVATVPGGSAEAGASRGCPVRGPVHSQHLILHEKLERCSFKHQMS